MAVKRDWFRTYGQFLPTGSTPTVANGNNTLSAESIGGDVTTSLRLRTDIELYVLCVGTGSANIDLSVFHETIMVVGSIAYQFGSVTTSDTPLTDANPPSEIPRIGTWGQWEYLYPTIDFVDTLTPQVALITWRPKDKTIDTQFRRVQTSSAGIDLFMPWEIQDGSGLINTTTGGVSYNLGARFAQSWLVETKS
jgi:hypothetical protein